MARRPDTIRRADGRAKFRDVPSFVREDRGIDLTATEARDVEDPDGGRVAWPSR